jgi:PIN domain nuclease of toxin-antitoxin system
VGRREVILLDTHAWLWWTADRGKLSRKVQRRLAASRELWISAISCWEVGMLVERGRLRLRGDARTAIREALSIDALRVAPVSDSIATEAGSFGASFHGDPADRIIVATAIALRATLVTKDERIRDAKLVATLW